MHHIFLQSFVLFDEIFKFNRLFDAENSTEGFASNFLNYLIKNLKSEILIFSITDFPIRQYLKKYRFYQFVQPLKLHTCIPIPKFHGKRTIPNKNNPILINLTLFQINKPKIIHINHYR